MRSPGVDGLRFLIITKTDEAIKANVHLFAITLKQLVGKSYIELANLIHFMSIGLG